MARILNKNTWTDRIENDIDVLLAWYTAHHDIAVSLEINYVVQGNYLTLRTRSQISSLIVELNVAKNRYDLAVISRLFKSD